MLGLALGYGIEGRAALLLESEFAAGGCCLEPTPMLGGNARLSVAVPGTALEDETPFGARAGLTYGGRSLTAHEAPASAPEDEPRTRGQSVLAGNAAVLYTLLPRSQDGLLTARGYHTLAFEVGAGWLHGDDSVEVPLTTSVGVYYAYYGINVDARWTILDLF